MVLNFDIDNKTRVIVLYQDAEMKNTRISKITGVPYSTVCKWIQKIDQGIDIREQNFRGRQPLIDEDLQKRVIKAAEKHPSKASTRNLAADFGIGKTAVNSILKEKGYKYKSVTPQIELTEEEKESRVNYCKDMLRNRGKKIYETCFSDETGISLSESYRKKAWESPSPKKKLKTEKPRKDVRLNCWAAISSNGATSLEIFKGPLDATRYKRILGKHKDEMDGMYPGGFYFQHDNLKVHLAAEKWGEDQGFSFIDFPTYSPDLTPIENLWGSLKQAVAVDNPKTESELRKSLKNNWEILTKPENLTNYIDTLENRYNDCLFFNGNYADL